MTLYEIDQTIKEVIENGFTVDEDGVITFEQGDLNALQEELETKVENIGLYIKNIDAEANAISEEIKTLTERKKVKENKRERLEEYLKGYFEQKGTKKFETARVLMSIRESEAVKIDDPDKLPDEYTNIRVECKPDKKLIKEALKAGQIIQGAEIVKNKNLTIK